MPPTKADPGGATRTGHAPYIHLTAMTKGGYGEIRLATQVPNQRTRTSAIDIENTFEGQKSKGLPSRGAGADKPTPKRENVSKQ